VVTGNGGFDANNHDYGDTMLKLTLARGKANRGSTTVRKAWALLETDSVMK